MAENCFYEQGLRFSCCAGCVSCCSGESGLVFLSDDDLENIAKAVSLNVCQTKEVYSKVFRSDNGVEHVVLREYSDGRCVFLGKEGCDIYEYRPSQCRAYPFWERIMKSEESWDEEGKACPGINAGDAIVSKEEIDRKLLGFAFPRDLR